MFRTPQRSFSAVSKPLFASKYSFSAFFEIYKMCILLHRSNLSDLTKFRQIVWCFFSTHFEKKGFLIISEYFSYYFSPSSQFFELLLEVHEIVCYFQFQRLHFHNNMFKPNPHMEITWNSHSFDGITHRAHASFIFHPWLFLFSISTVCSIQFQYFHFISYFQTRSSGREILENYRRLVYFPEFSREY